MPEKITQERIRPEPYSIRHVFRPIDCLLDKDWAPSAHGIAPSPEKIEAVIDQLFIAEEANMKAIAEAVRRFKSIPKVKD